MTTTIQLRRDTAANWTLNNPVLALGEPGVETDSRKVKYGDGSSTWSALSYSAGTSDYNDLSNKPTIPTDISDLTDNTSLLGQGTGSGAEGASAYDIAVNNGFEGTEQQWLDSLVGEPGTNGTNGEPGQGVPTGGTVGQVLVKVDGDDYNTEWIDQTSGTGSTTLSELTDVALEEPSQGQVLTWNNNQSKWENQGLPSPSEITNTNSDPYQLSTYSVSVSTTGIVTMSTARGSLEFGAQPEEGAPQHLHIMRPADQASSTDLYFGDDYNYVKLPGNYGVGTLGVEIGANDNDSGAQSVWRFGIDGTLTVPGIIDRANRLTLNSVAVESSNVAAVVADGEAGRVFVRTDNGTTTKSWEFDINGNLRLPQGGDIVDSAGQSVLGGGSSTNTGTGDIVFSGGVLSNPNDNEIRLESQDINQTASYNFTPQNGDYSTAVWDGTNITFNDPTQPIYDAIWALNDVSVVEVQVAGTWYTVTYGGSSTPGMPQAPILFINQTAVDGPLNIDNVQIIINQGTTSYAEISGTDFRVDVQDDIRMYANDRFVLSNRGIGDSIEIETNDGEHTWYFKADGNLELPSGGGIVDSNGTSVLGRGSTGFTRFINRGIGSYDNGSFYDMTIAPNWDGEFTGHTYINLPSNENFGSPLQIVHNSDGGIQLITKNNATWTFDKDGVLTLAGNLVSNGASPAPSINGFDSASFSGNVTANVGTFTSIASVAVANVKISGGTNGQVLTTDGTGNLSFTTVSGGSSSPAGAGSPSYNDVWVLSSKGTDTNFWASYTLTGSVKQLYDFNNTGSLTLTAQEVYGKQVSTGSKTLVINNGKISSNSYGIVIEFPSDPSVGDTFSCPVTGTTSTTITAGSFVPGQTYTIVEVGTTNWASIGASSSVVGQTFIATGVGAGTGTASISNGVAKLIFKPAAGQTAYTLQQGQNSSSIQFGQGTSIVATYVEITSMGGQPIAWVYAGVINSVPTWYQLYL